MPTTRHTRRTTENPSPLQELQAPIRSRTQPMASIDEFQDSGDERRQSAEIPRPSVERSVPETPTGTVPSRESTRTPVGRQTASEDPAHSPNNPFFVRRDPTEDAGAMMARAMAQEWRRIAQEDSRSSAPSSSSAKVRKPDPFDGSDPHKLDTFFT